ncbi:MAG: NAD(P)-binding domain-containing protein, partial [Chloroflexota bacterium]|nr:NAD(P)-binding domain-containing protein [Chloroflexota bacterium]
MAQRAGRRVTLVTRSPMLSSYLTVHRTHPTSLPGIVVPTSIEITSDFCAAVEESEVVIVAVPTQSLREAIAPYVSQLRDKPLVSAAKGLEQGTLRRPTQILADVLGEWHAAPLCALSGPNLASEVALGKPTTTVIAAEAPEIAAAMQRALTSS